ncbi:hypothetical protein [Pseudorhodoplanes sp.]|uniref:hypothetical protein n=1 Tax=Pseudorhodoplanes sp. TaxID=1934341 RepID=UPI00391AEDC0
MNEIIDGLQKIFQLVINSRETAILSAVGLLLLVITLFTLIHIVRKPDASRRSLLAFSFLGLITGIMFSAAGPILALFWVAQNPIKSTTLEQRISRLESNEQVYWLVRLVSYYPAYDPDLAVGKLRRLGPERHLYTFVAPYEDLVGVPIVAAIQMTGGTYKPGQHVSAILFPLKVQLYPASARGLLQVIHDVEHNPNADIKNAFLKGTNQLSAPELDDLKDTRIPSYKFASFQDKFKNYCELAHRFRCGSSYSARNYIGDIGVDWHPLGFAQKDAEHDPCRNNQLNYCSLPNWGAAKTHFQKFGTRVFLIRNLELSQIPDRVLMDFQDPAQRVIPELGLPPTVARR